MKTKYPMYVVMLSSFSHDSNGNPTALHAVYGYSSATQPTSDPTATLHEGKRRAQVGYSDKRDCHAPTALGNAGVPRDLTLRRVEGSRSEGFMKLVYF